MVRPGHGSTSLLGHGSTQMCQEDMVRPMKNVSEDIVRPGNVVFIKQHMKNCKRMSILALLEECLELLPILW